MIEDLNGNSYKYVLVGGGMSAGFATLGIREEDKEGSILIISRESHVPYERPALSKKLWRDDEYHVDRTKIGAEEEPNVDFAFERDVISISPENKTVKLENGDIVNYEKLLLSTGGEPYSIEGEKDQNVFLFRTKDDYLKLRELTKENSHILLVGGGYVGSELADSLIRHNVQVTMVFPEKKLGENAFPEELLEDYNSLFTDRGVKLYPERKAVRYHRNNNQLVLKLDDGTEINGDAIVIGLGVKPRTELAEQAGLEMSKNGVLVNESLQTSDPNIYAAGDIATYPDKILGLQRIEHVDHARNSGKQVGAIMAGSTEPYGHTPYFYSMLHNLSWQAVGTIDPKLDTLFDNRENGSIVFYLEGEILKGVLLWNVKVDLNDVRELLANQPINNENLIGLLKEE